MEPPAARNASANAAVKQQRRTPQPPAADIFTGGFPRNTAIHKRQ
jgi:hypothetical protein